MLDKALTQSLGKRKRNRNIFVPSLAVFVCKIPNIFTRANPHSDFIRVNQF